MIVIGNENLAADDGITMELGNAGSGRRKKLERIFGIVLFWGLIIVSTVCSTCDIAWANGNVSGSIADILGDFVSIITTIFQAVGVILGVYSAGQLIMAFKNDDADSKSRAGTMLVTAISLIAFPVVVGKLNLVGRLG